MLDSGDGLAPKRVHAAVVFFAAAKFRAKAALGKKLGGGNGWKFARLRKAGVLDDLEFRFVVGNEPLIDVTEVEALPDYALRLKFSNGERRIFLMAPFMSESPYKRLTPARFALARVRHGTVSWPGGIDIAPEILFDRSSR
jgi:hypothetical protein